MTSDKVALLDVITKEIVKELNNDEELCIIDNQLYINERSLTLDEIDNDMLHAYISLLLQQLPSGFNCTISKGGFECHN